MLRALVVCVLTSLVLVAASPAQADPLPVTTTAPPSGATVAPLDASSAGMRLELTSPITGITGMYVEVATQSAPLGQDGTLADDFREDFFAFHESDAYPGTYAGTSNHVPSGYWWTSAPGTYYWQVHASYIDPANPSELKTYVSPVFSLTIATPQQPPAQPPANPQPPSTASQYLTKTEAVGTARRIIKDETGRSARHLKARCSRRSNTRFSCKLTWDNGAYTARRLWYYTGTMNLAERERDYRYTFRGARANDACIDRKSVNACLRSVRW